MTRVLVLGAGGMLGHKVIQRLGASFTVTGAARAKDEAMVELQRLTGAEIDGGLDVEDFSTVQRLVRKRKPDVVVNCVGIIKQRAAAKDAIQSIKVNSLFPHELSALLVESGGRVIHLSTDCVFSGDRGLYEENERPDPVDTYGRSKLLGETAVENAVTLRTSMVGREIRTLHSLFEWFLRQPKGSVVKGYRRAVFSGLTTLALADEIARVIGRPEVHGLYHLSADPINKYDLLSLVRDAFEHQVEIVPDDAFFCDRSLVSDRYRKTMGYTPMPWAEMVAEVAADQTPYERLQALATAA